MRFHVSFSIGASTRILETSQKFNWVRFSRSDLIEWNRSGQAKTYVYVSGFQSQPHAIISIIILNTELDHIRRINYMRYVYSEPNMQHSAET